MHRLYKVLLLLAGGIFLFLVIAGILSPKELTLQTLIQLADHQGLPVPFLLAERSTSTDPEEGGFHSKEVQGSRSEQTIALSEPFLQIMGNFPWTEALANLENMNTTLSYSQILLDKLTAGLVREPVNPPIEECQPPPLMQAEDIDCSKYPTAFTEATSRQIPVKVAHLVQLGFDADMLELLMRELDDVVDKFFIIESTRTHNKGIRKILLWDQVKNQLRFNFVKDKVVHLVLDDAEAFTDPKVPFAVEILQEKVRWESFLRWNAHTQFFGPNDLVGFGDVDEIPSRDNVQLLRHCQMVGSSVDIGVWFAWTRLNEAFRPDWPVPGNPWTLGDPTYWTVAAATDFGQDGTKFPSRKRGQSGFFLLGGIHMTDNGYLPFIMAKLIACTECGDSAAALITQFASYFQEGKPTANNMIELDKSIDRSKSYRSRFEKVADIKDELGAAYYLPWFLKCNPQRYPSWYGKADSRLHQG